MALKYSDLKKKEEGLSLTEKQLEYIDRIEKYIDEEITKHWITGSVKILLPIAHFELDPFLNHQTDFNYIAREKMQTILENRYKNAGWSIDLHIDDGLDGPMMSGADYWILSPKKR